LWLQLKEGIGDEREGEDRVTLWIPLFRCSIIQKVSPLLYFNNNLKPTQNMQEIVQSTYSTFYILFFCFSTNPRPLPQTHTTTSTSKRILRTQYMDKILQALKSSNELFICTWISEAKLQMLLVSDNPVGFGKLFDAPVLVVAHKEFGVHWIWQWQILTLWSFSIPSKTIYFELCTI